MVSPCQPQAACAFTGLLFTYIARKMALKAALALVSVLACVAGGLAARASHPAEHVIANKPAEHAASQPASYSLAAAQVGVLLIQAGMRPRSALADGCGVACRLIQRRRSKRS